MAARRQEWMPRPMGDSPVLPPDARTFVGTRPSPDEGGDADPKGASSLPRVLVFGHSHMGALIEAYAAAASGTVAFQLVSYQFLRPERPHIVLAEGKWQYHPECRRELHQLIAATRPRLLVSMLQGEQAILAGLTAPERPFEFFFPGEEAHCEEARGDEVRGDETAEIIPFDALLESCKLEYGLISDLLDHLEGANARPSLALSPPPPIGDGDFILASGQQANIAELISARGLPATAWRRRVWRLHAEALRAIYRDHGIPFADPPAAAYGGDGCLLQPFWSDALHANSAYGQLLLRQIGAVLTEGS
jgi:hypothetical protein